MNIPDSTNIFDAMLARAWSRHWPIPTRSTCFGLHPKSKAGAIRNNPAASPRLLSTSVLPRYVAIAGGLVSTSTAATLPAIRAVLPRYVAIVGGTICRFHSLGIAEIAARAEAGVRGACTIYVARKSGLQPLSYFLQDASGSVVERPTRALFGAL